MSAKQTAKQDRDLDAEIMAAFEALDATAPEHDLYELEARLLARLEEEDMTEMSNETTTAERDPATLGKAGELHDDAELHDIKALAATTKLRISQRMAAQVVDERSELVSCHTSAGPPGASPASRRIRPDACHTRERTPPPSAPLAFTRRVVCSK